MTVDWHDSSCGKWDGKDMFGEYLSFPCDCGFPELVAGAIEGERKRIRLALKTDRAMRDILVVLPPPADFKAYRDSVRQRLLAYLVPS